MERLQYFDQDFPWTEWAEEMMKVPLPAIHSSLDDWHGSNACSDIHWESLFQSHSTGQLYKPRNYLYKEFQEYLMNCKTLLEVGCGYGSSTYALIDKIPLLEHYIATDQSIKALEILSLNAKYNNEKIIPFPWDFANHPPSNDVTSYSPDVIFAVFAFSALPTIELHKQALKNIILSFQLTLKPIYLLFRDYGMYDMTMFRHRQRLDEHTFVRSDHTICYYFTIEYLEHLMLELGFIIKELRYATVINKNKKEEKVMHRVFVHGVFEYNTHLK
jgi:methyltransferase-like protein 6